MNNPITKLKSGDFKVDPILAKARAEAIKDMEDAGLNKNKLLKFPYLGKEDIEL